MESLCEIKNAVVTTGSFDGVHHGHSYIIGLMNKLAKQINGESVLITFHPHPRKVLNPESKEQLILSQREKMKALEATGLDHVVVITFTIEFAKMSPMDFIRKYIVERIHAKKVIIGYDHAFGANREGNFEYLYELGKYYGFEVIEIEAQDVKHVSVSSTKIRRALMDGDILRANDYLGHSYIVEGKVIHGSRLGRKIGFRTANVKIEEDVKLLPYTGVYIVKVNIENKNYKGIVHISRTENIASGKESNRILKVHILDFNDDIYDQYICLSFIGRLRDVKEFRNVNSLINQLKADRNSVAQLKLTDEKRWNISA